jgi:hypothetical protein
VSVAAASCQRLRDVRSLAPWRVDDRALGFAGATAFPLSKELTLLDAAASDDVDAAPSGGQADAGRSER